MPSQILRRLLCGSVLCISGLILVLSVKGQPNKEKPQPPAVERLIVPPAAQFSGFKRPEDPQFRAYLLAGREFIEEKDWPKAILALQRILDSDDNPQVRIRDKDARGRDTLHWIDARIEANKLIGSLPKEGLDRYETEFGERAKNLLKDARQKVDLADFAPLASVAWRYQYTRAGLEANVLLASAALQQGHHAVAARHFDKLLDMNPEWTNLGDDTILKAVIAFRRLGENKRADEIWKRLEPRLKKTGGLQIDEGVVVPVARVSEMVNGVAGLADGNPFEGKLPANGMVSQPDLDKLVIPAHPTLDRGEDNDRARKVLAEALKPQRDLGAPILSGFFPMVLDDKVMFRTQKDVRSVHLFDFKDSKGRKFPAGDIFWIAPGFGFDNSLANMMESPALRPTLENWLGQFNREPASRAFLYENSMLGNTSTENRLLYAVDDLAIPTPPNQMMQHMIQPQTLSAAVKLRVIQNMLFAFDWTTGKEVWNLGTRSSIDSRDEADSVFADSHFLGAPCVVAGKLYVLNEKNKGLTGDAEMRLVCIDSDPARVKHGRPRVVSVLNLATISEWHRFSHDPLRRTNAVNLVHSGGMLVCPTHAGEVLGIDLVSGSLAWSYPYRKESRVAKVGAPIRAFPPAKPGPLALMPPRWKSAPPVIQDGKVIFTAPDAQSVHCIALKDGSPIWTRKQADGDLFLAGVFAGKVLIVGQKNVRALNLADGELLWQSPLGGVPSGQGAFSRNLYYQPIKTAEKNAAIVAIDLGKGAVSVAGKSTAEVDLGPGNLAFYPGMIVALSPLEVKVHPERNAVKIALDLRSRAITAAVQGTPRPKLLQAWQNLAKLPDHPFRDEAKQMIGHYESLITLDAALAKAGKGQKDLVTMSVKEKAKYWLDELRDHSITQQTEPGQCHVLGEFFSLFPRQYSTERTPALELVRLGKDALPEIIAHLDDPRPTRCLGYWRSGTPETHYLLRYGDCCQQIFEAITGHTIYQRKHSAGYPILDGQGPQCKARAEQWLRENKQKNDKQP